MIHSFHLVIHCVCVFDRSLINGPSVVLDLIVQAKSGTGKTCVFSTIALDSLVLENPTTQVSRATPTLQVKAAQQQQCAIKILLQLCLSQI